MLLASLHAYVLDEAEVELFARLITNIDNILALQKLIKSKDAERPAAIPAIASQVKAHVARLANTIVDYSEERARSPTKHRKMKEAVADIIGSLDDIVHNITMTLASIPAAKLMKEP